MASHPKFAFTPTFIVCSPICPDNCGVVFLWKYILVFEKWSFSFDRSNMQIFTVNITRVVWPRVTNILDLRYFCQHNSSLIICHYWSWKIHIHFVKELPLHSPLLKYIHSSGKKKLQTRVLFSFQILLFCFYLSWSYFQVFL